MRLEFSRQIFEEHSNIKFYYMFWGSRIVPCEQTDGRTDRYDEANGRLSQFRECS